MINSGAETIQIFFWFKQRKNHFCLRRRKMDAQGITSSFNRHRKIFSIQSASFCQKRPNQLSGFDEDLFVNSFANDRTLVSLLEEFRIVRQTSIIFFENLQNVTLTNTGKANGNEISVETIGRLIVGHNFHHLKIIEKDIYRI